MQLCNAIKTIETRIEKKQTDTLKNVNFQTLRFKKNNNICEDCDDRTA